MASQNGGRTSTQRPISVAIIGAGMSGLCMAAKLQDAGINDFTIFEAADEVGGTWRDNTYPGLTCDIPSRYYSYSFRPNPEWSHMLPPGPEIQQYFRQVATERDIRSRIRFGTDVTEAAEVPACSASSTAHSGVRSRVRGNASSWARTSCAVYGPSCA